MKLLKPKDFLFRIVEIENYGLYQNTILEDKLLNLNSKSLKNLKKKYPKILSLEIAISEKKVYIPDEYDENGNLEKEGYNTYILDWKEVFKF